MKTRLATCLVAVLSAATLLPDPAAGQIDLPGAQARRPIRIGFAGGMSAPTGGAADAFDSGLNGQAYLLIDTGFLPPLRFNLGFQKFDFKEALLGGARGSSSILSGVAGITFDLFNLGPVRPYVTAGLGAFHISDDLTVDDGTFDEPVSTSTTKFGIDGGAGIAVRLGRLDGFVEARLQNVYTDAGFIDTRSIRAIPIAFGILF